MQKHNIQLTSKVVDDIKLRVAMETLTNEMEARFDATFARFELAQNQRVSDLITNEELQKHLTDKVRKRQFEVTIE